MFGAGKLGHLRPGAGRDEDIFRGDELSTRQAQLVRPLDGRALAEDSDLVVVERLRVEPLEPVDIGEHMVAQHRPVEGEVRHIPAEAARVLDVLGEMRAIDEHLLGDAAADHAGAADPIFLRDRHPRAIAGRDPRRAHAARTRTDHEQVEIIVAHHIVLESPVARIWGRGAAQAKQFCL